MNGLKYTILVVILTTLVLISDELMSYLNPKLLSLTQAKLTLPAHFLITTAG